jgi:hypothetical protein
LIPHREQGRWRASLRRSERETMILAVLFANSEGNILIER